MFDDEAQFALDEALKSGDATYDIVPRRQALVLKVKNGSDLIPIIDRIFDYSNLDFNANFQRNPSNAVPALTIGEYVVTPKYERKEGTEYHEYELIYAHLNTAKM